jgi:hypothetical protein
MYILFNMLLSCFKCCIYVNIVGVVLPCTCVWSVENQSLWRAYEVLVAFKMNLFLSLQGCESV